MKDGFCLETRVHVLHQERFDLDSYEQYLRRSIVDGVIELGRDPVEELRVVYEQDMLTFT